MADDAVISVEVNLTRASAYLARLAPEAIDRTARAAMEESLGYLQTEVQKGTPRDRGLLRGGIFTEMRGRTSEGLRGVVSSPPGAPYAIVIERGRRPGKFPPLDAIIGWVHRKGLAGVGSHSYSLITRRRVSRQETQAREERRIAWAIARKIQARGFAPPHTDGWRMFENAARTGKDRIEAIFLRRFKRSLE